jgi:hypothetical protein
MAPKPPNAPGSLIAPGKGRPPIDVELLPQSQQLGHGAGAFGRRDVGVEGGGHLQGRPATGPPRSG